MLTDKSQTAQTPKLTMPEKLTQIQSLIATSRLACAHLNDNADSEYYSIGETLAIAESMVGECAEELEAKQPA